MFFAVLWSADAEPLSQIIRTNQQGQMIVKERDVHYIPDRKTPEVAKANQWLAFEDALHTLALSRATVRLTDWTSVNLDDHTYLTIQRRPDTPKAPGLHLREGELHLSSRGIEDSIILKTPHVEGKPKGTEFLVQVKNNVTTFTMFDGEVALRNDASPIPTIIHSGQQGIAEFGAPIRVESLKSRTSLVQWWLYYPAILNPGELVFSKQEADLLAASLSAYRSGNLKKALEAYPGYPQLLAPSSDAVRIYQAAVLLAVGAVDRTEKLLEAVEMKQDASASALSLLIKTITGSTDKGATMTTLGSAWKSNSCSYLLSLAYAHQSTNNLADALRAARLATSVRSDFSFAWAQVAELEFSFGRTRKALEAVERALELSPENPQALAVRGFLLAAEYRIKEAIVEFDRALEIDPALGNAWLGRGLCKRRMGILAPQAFRDADSGKVGSWLSDLQTAAAVEPGRSLVRAYAGKAFSEVGEERLALKELSYAAQLDPADPTPPLFRALELQRQNRPNEAVRELQRSMELNDNRAIYRPRLLLDQDQAVRGASLAKIYQDAGLQEVAVREAARAVSYDYSSHAAHQFLAESYNALRDPARFNLRYETVWFNELLLANIMSPVGSGLLSQNISQQEYSRLFDANKIGLKTSSEYRSDGQFREVVSQYGIAGKSAYTLDLDYQHNQGTRPNNDLSRVEWYSQFKHQLNDRDAVFLLTKYQDYESGDSFQDYDRSTNSRPNFRFEERQSPLLFLAMNRQWSPGSLSTVSIGRLDNHQTLSDSKTSQLVLTRDPAGQIVSDFQHLRLDAAYDGTFEIFHGEINHILHSDWQTLNLGSRAQSGTFDTVATLSNPTNSVAALLPSPPSRDLLSQPFQRLSGYIYETVRPHPTFALTLGLAADSMRYPLNYRSPPLTDGTTERLKVDPKAAVVWSPAHSLTVRAVYAVSSGGVSFDETFRLEPTSLVGFPQAFRSLISESVVGSVTAPHSRVAGLGVDLRAQHGYFVSLTGQALQSDVSGPIGVFFDNNSSQALPRAFPGATHQMLGYSEYDCTAAVTKLVSQNWVFRCGYEISDSILNNRYPQVPTSLSLFADQTRRSTLQILSGSAQLQIPQGPFLRLYGAWWFQRNYDSAASGSRDNFPMLDIISGYRFARGRGEVSLGALNLTSERSFLSPLSQHLELPQSLVWVLRTQLNF